MWHLLKKRQILFVTIFVLLVASSFLLGDEESNVPSGWNVYRNDKYDFSVSYPGNWYYGQRAGGASTPFAVSFSSDRDFVETGPQAPGYRPKDWINLVLINTEDSAEKYSTGDLKARHVVVKSSQSILAGGKTVLLAQGVMTNGQFYGAAYVRSPEYLYAFESLDSEAEAEASLELMKKMALSLEF